MNLMDEAPDAGLLALFESPDDLVHAIEKVKKQRYRKVEAYTPFPIHEVIHALGIKRSKIPWGTLFMCLLGGTLGFGMQAWMNGISWPINVAGKPFISAPAFVPITFELTVLIGGISTVVLLFLMCGLPNRHKAVLDHRLTDDLFGLYVEKSDPRFNEGELQGIFRDCHVKEIKNFGD
ncbi:MAG: DUF3341 domain-containing protein [Deltaproteobacteria bacterium]|nr:DUF3341 domain-containing protein [Deltaproteobacteria bacterium]